MAHLALQSAIELVERALKSAGAGPDMARAASLCLVRAEAQGLASHGLYRVGQYAIHLRNGRANGAAIPTVLKRKPAALLIDAQGAMDRADRGGRGRIAGCRARRQPDGGVGPATQQLTRPLQGRRQPGRGRLGVDEHRPPVDRPDFGRPA